MFYASVWDPWLILSQMALLQCALYLSAGCWLILFGLTFGSQLRLGALLSPAQMSLARGGGWAVLGAWALSAPLLSYALLHAVGRAKQCMDFTLSMYGLHVLACWIYSGSLPRTWEWWVVNLCGCVVTVVLGEYLCLARELEAIPITADERTQRERRAAAQAAINASNLNGGGSGVGNGASSQEMGRPAERTSLLGSYDDDSSNGGGLGGGSGGGNKGVTTSTIRLAPNNVFNV